MKEQTKKNLKTAATVTGLALGATYLVMRHIAKKQYPDSVYANQPEEQNPVEGRKVVFVEDVNDPVNADGKQGHLEAVGNSTHIPTFYEKYIKRGFDVVLSFGGLVALAPVYAITALAIKTDDPGPVLFKQKRVAQNKGYFQLLKFRSMSVNTPKDVPTHMLQNGGITIVGGFIRKTSIDELPQLWNIFRGNMSVIGPRPALWNQDYLTAERDKYGANDVKPGLTGLAQISGRDELEIEEKAKFDGVYADALKLSSWSGFIMDCKMFLGSISSVLRSKGVVEGGTGAIAKEFAKADNMSDDTYENALVSIIMPSYNTASYIAKTINSVLNQTYENWELIIVDDCSTDNTDEVIAPYLSDSRIKLFKNEVNSGAAVSRNRALREAQGHWIAFLDSDDLWMPNKLEKQICFMEENGYHFSYTNYTEIDDSDESLGTLWTGPRKIDCIRMSMFNYMGCLTVMYDRDYVGLIQVADIKKRNDYAIWVKVVKKCDAYLLDECLSTYRVRSSGSIMNRGKNPLGRMKYNYQMWRESEGKSALKAFVLTGVNSVFGALKKIKYREAN